MKTHPVSPLPLARDGVFPSSLAGEAGRGVDGVHDETSIEFAVAISGPALRHDPLPNPPHKGEGVRHRDAREFLRERERDLIKRSLRKGWGAGVLSPLPGLALVWWTLGLVSFVRG